MAKSRGRHARNKGKAGEREVAHALQRLFGVEARRGRQFKGTRDSPDIVHSIPEVYIEVKRRETLNVYKALQKAEEESEGDLPIVIHRRNEMPWLVTLTLEDLPALAIILNKVLEEENDD